LFLNSFPAPALPGSGSEGMISALVLRHPYWFIAKVIQKRQNQETRSKKQDLRPETEKAGRLKIPLIWVELVRLAILPFGESEGCAGKT